MSDNTDLYSQLKPDIERLVLPLFDVSELFLKKRGAFLPHAAILRSTGEVEMVNFAPEDFESRSVNATEILAGVHAALREAVKSKDVIAIGVAEDVSIMPEGEKKTKAIKVLFEHQAGLVVALYLPWKRKLLGGIETSSPISMSATGQVCAWGK
jgi:hypothetical protein